MKINFFYLLFVAILLSSCLEERDWDYTTIPAQEKLQFSQIDKFGDRSIIVIVNKDTMVIKRKDLVDKVCYLKAAFPDKDITIDYVRENKGGKISYDPRYINLPANKR